MNASFLANKYRLKLADFTVSPQAEAGGLGGLAEGAEGVAALGERKAGAHAEESGFGGLCQPAQRLPRTGLPEETRALQVSSSVRISIGAQIGVVGGGGSEFCIIGSLRWCSSQD